MEFRYSQILTNIFMTYFYGTGMPALYAMCFVAFVLTYWVDKYLFLRVYRTPPRYDIALMRTVRSTLKYAVVCHFLIGFYMVSNTRILTYNSKVSFLAVFEDTVANARTYLGNGQQFSAERFVTTHTLIYLLGIVVILLLYLLMTICARPLSAVFSFCCCLAIKDSCFSNDIYDDLHVTDLKGEYIKTKNDLDDYKSLIGDKSKALGLADSVETRHATAAL